MNRSRLWSAYISHDPVNLVCQDVSRTRQEFADECDVNLMMERFQKSGGVFPLGKPDNAPGYFDTTLFTTDFREALDMFDHAATQFMTLPANVRREFDNDPAKFVDFAIDPSNLAKMREWGLAEPEKGEDPPMRVTVVGSPAGLPGQPAGSSGASEGAPTQ